MKVYKFGGASVRDADGVRNLQQIVAREHDDLVVVVSAMGKTTNALETLVSAITAGDEQGEIQRVNDILSYHSTIIRDLGLSASLPERLHDLVKETLKQVKQQVASHEQTYAAIVSMGEVLSTLIVTSYLQYCDIPAVLWDMTQLLRTDDTYREAQVDMSASYECIKKEWENTPVRRIVVAQGFIGGTFDGHPTTLGREGSDYSAALVGNILDAESVTIWKDVPGVLNADPRLVAETIKIDELSYGDAVELAYSGAQIIHPKTIRPLENKHIPLYVKPFYDVQAVGSVIRQGTQPIGVPVYIWRQNQVLITVRAKDFAFVLEESLSHIFDIIHRYRLKVSLIQSSAITISVCVDNSMYVSQVINELEKDFAVSWNEGLKLLTIRGTTPDILEKEKAGRTILLSQTTRRTARLIIKDNI